MVAHQDQRWSCATVIAYLIADGGDVGLSAEGVDLVHAVFQG